MTITAIAAATGIIGGTVTAALATKATKATKANDVEKVDKIANALNRATSVFLRDTDTYILNVSKLREYGRGCCIDMHLCNNHTYAPIDSVFAMNESARAYVSEINPDIFFDAMTVAMNDGRVTRYLLFQLIAGKWIFVGSPYEYDNAYTQIAHRIVWDYYHTIKEGDANTNRGKCRVI